MKDIGFRIHTWIGLLASWEAGRRIVAWALLVVLMVASATVTALGLTLLVEALGGGSS